MAQRGAQSVFSPKQSTRAQINRRKGKAPRIGLRTDSSSPLFSGLGPVRLFHFRRLKNVALWEKELKGGFIFIAVITHKNAANTTHS